MSFHILYLLSNFLSVFFHLPTIAWGNETSPQDAEITVRPNTISFASGSTEKLVSGAREPSTVHVPWAEWTYKNDLITKFLNKQQMFNTGWEWK